MRDAATTNIQRLTRRHFLIAGSACVASCMADPRLVPLTSTSRLDRLLAAHRDAPPENAGGANHYPMAAEVLAARGFDDAIDDAWIEGVALYAGEPGREAALTNAAQLNAALGSYERFGDWLDHFRAALRQEPWSSVVARWAPRLAPAISAAAFHGVIRTGHAVRALRQRETGPRLDELAVGLAYWAARYAELPTTASAHDPQRGLGETLVDLPHPWIDANEDVGFHEVGGRLTGTPLAPPVMVDGGGDRAAARTELQVIVREAATAFLEMLVLERNRMWLLHTVTGPAAVEWLLPHVDDDGARKLVAYARQAVVAMYAAYGEPFTPREHVRDDTADWPEQVQRAVDSRSVHGIKLIDALLRFRRDDDPVWRSVAAQWFEWT